MDEWLYNFYAYVDYVYDHKAYPKRDQKYKGYSIGVWENKQRLIKNKGKKLSDGSYIYKNSILTKERIKMLDDIHFIWDKREYNWLENYNLLKGYIKENNRYPKTDEIYKDKAISSWIENIRYIFATGSVEDDGSIKRPGGILTKKQIELLNDMNFVWIGMTKNFYKADIKNIKDLKSKRLYLEIMFLRLLKEKNYQINDFSQINNDFIKMLNKR